MQWVGIGRARRGQGNGAHEARGRERTAHPGGWQGLQYDFSITLEGGGARWKPEKKTGVNNEESWTPR